MIKTGRLQGLILLVFITVSCVLVLFTGVVYYDLTHNEQNSNRQKNILAILSATNILREDVMEMEQNFMGFVITGKEKYAHDYNLVAAKYPGDLLSLKKVNFDEAADRIFLDSLSSGIVNFAQLTQTLLSQKNDDARQVLMDAESAEIEHIERLIHVIEKREKQKLHLLEKERNQQYGNTVLLFVVFSALLFTFLLAAFLLIRKALKTRNDVKWRLQRSVDSFALLFYKSPVINLISTFATGEILMVNEAFEHASGYTAGEVVGKTGVALNAWVDSAEEENMIATIAAQGNIRNKEIRGRKKSGELIWLSLSAEIIWHNDEKCLLVATLDITQQKEDARKLEESQKLFSSIFYKSPVAFSISKVATAEIIDANENFGAFFGYTRQEVIGQSSNTLKLWHSEADRASTLSHLRNKNPDNLEIQMRHKSGIIKDILANGDILALNGEDYLISAFVDITQRKDAERQLLALNNSLEHIVLERTKEISAYQKALDIAGIIAVLDQDFNVKHANDNYCNISGWMKDELIGKNMSNLGVRFTKFKNVSNFQAFVIEGNIWQGEVERTAKDGHTYWTYTSLIPFINEFNEVYQYLSISFDITATKRVQQELQATLTELENLSCLLNEAQSIALMGSWEINVTTGKHTWSDEVYHILGTQKGKVEPSFASFRQFVHPEDVGIVEKAYITRKKRVEKLQIYCRLILHDSTEKYVFNEIRATYDEEDKLLRLNGVIIDETDKRKTQLEKAKITADLIRRNNSLERFAHIVAHNLRAPLANISGLASLLYILEPGSSESQKALSHLLFSVGRLDEVINDLNGILDLHAASHGQFEAIRIQELVLHVYHDMEGFMEKSGATIALHIPPESTVIAVKSHLIYCLRNLFSNAVKFRDADRPLVITVSSETTEIGTRITVADNGMGMDLVLFGNKIFGLYNKQHADDNGKGMGLFMTKSLIEAMDGTISVESEPGQGSVFHIFLKSDNTESLHNTDHPLLGA